LKSNKKIVAIVEARMTSSRLPGKHLMEILGRPILGYLIDRLKTIESIDSIIIATTKNQTDDVLVEFANNSGVEVYRGDENDVMGRVLCAAKYFQADIICEVTGDCPIIDPQLVEQVVQTFLHNKVVYVNNGKQGIPDGMGAQVFSTAALEKSASQTNELLDREHVTLHIRNNPSQFPAIYIGSMPSMNRPELAVTLDVREDFELIKKIIEYFNMSKPLFGCLDVISLLESKENWIEINSHINRKGDS